MKAKIVQEKIYEDCVHYDLVTVKWLVMEEADNLAITFHNKEVDAFTGFEIKGDCNVIGEVEVPDELVEKVLAFVRAKAEFNGLKRSFEALLG